MRISSSALLCLAAALPACTDDPPPSGPYIESHVDYWDIPSAPPPSLDLLFVVDDTAAMASQRTKLLGLASTFDTTLFGEDGPFFDTRIAVTTAQGTGAFRQPSGVTDPFLAIGLDPHYELTGNFTGSLTDALSPLLDVGASGSTAIAPLASAKAALDSHPAFQRDHTVLGVVTIVSSDDASAGEPVAYADSLKGRQSDPARVAVTAAYPMPASRLDAYHTAFPNRNTVVELASSDWSSLAALFPQLRLSTLGAACERFPADLDPDVPGIQPDCVVEAIYTDDTTEIIPWCTEGGPARCFEIVDDPNLCGQYDVINGRLRVHGYAGGYVPWVRGQCVVF